VKKFIIIVTLCLMVCGCAKLKNKISRDGGFFGSYPGDYVVISQSGGVIMDVYKLNNVMVQSEENSDGWLFKDQIGNVINLGGDIKVIRVTSRNTSDLWGNYEEYHMEFEEQTYREKFNK